MFENKGVCGIHASRYIASWVKVGGKLSSHEDVNNFKRWLLYIGVSEEDSIYISELANNGKMELEVSARRFLENS